MSPVRRVLLDHPFAHQQLMLMSPKRVKVACLGRQSGKTACGTMAALDGHGPTELDGTPAFKGALYGMSIIWATKDYPTGTKIWRDLKFCLRKWGGDLEKSEQDRRIAFPGGGSIVLRSASEPDSMRGDTYDGLVGDEVAFWHPESLTNVRPALAVRQGWQFLISTPRGFDQFHDEWRKGSEHTDPDYESWQMPSSINPAFPQEEFEKARVRNSPGKFATEYLAEFAVTGGSIFRRDWFRGFTQDADRFYPEIGEPVMKYHVKTFMSADFALTKQTYSDHTAIAVVSVAPDGCIFMVDMIRTKVTRAELIPLVKSIQDRWSALFLYCESSGELANLNADLKKAGVRIRERRIHQKFEGRRGEDKVTRAYEASKAVELARIFFLHQKQPNGATSPATWVGDLSAECGGFDGQEGRPDDQVDALSLAVLGTQFLSFAPVSDYDRKDRREEEVEEKEGTGWKIGR